MLRESADAEAVGFEADAFFAAYEQELATMDVTAVAHAALDGILRIQDKEGQTKTYRQIQAEAEAFFANPLIAADLQLLGSLATQYAVFCTSHGHGTNEELTSDFLEDILGRDVAQTDSRHDHEHGHRGAKKDKKKAERARRKGLWLLAMADSN